MMAISAKRLVNRFIFFLYRNSFRCQLFSSYFLYFLQVETNLANEVFALVKKVSDQGKLKAGDYTERTRILLQHVSKRNITEPGLRLPSEVDCTCNVATLAGQLFGGISQFVAENYCGCSWFHKKRKVSNFFEAKHSELKEWSPQKLGSEDDSSLFAPIFEVEELPKRKCKEECKKSKIWKITSTS